MSAAQLRKLIHVGCKQLGLDDDARREVQLLRTGKASMRDMTEGELRAVLDGLKAAGFKPDAKGGYAPASRADLRLVHVLWRKLSEAGKVRVPGRKGLNAFVRSRFEKSWGSVPLDIDALRDWQKIDAVIRALTDWCEREGIELDYAAMGRRR